jgi:type IV secretion system protein VirD4
MASLALGLLVGAAHLASVVTARVLGVRDLAVTPLTAFQYGVYHWDVAPVRSALAVGAAAALGLMGLVMAGVVSWRTRLPPLHGDARFARPAEIRRIGFFDDEGVVVGRLGRRFLRYDARRGTSPHVFVAAPTGGGKTQGIMLPNALSWPGAMVVLDIKGEVYDASAGYRAEAGHEVVLLDFAADGGHSHRYNPFAYVDPRSPTLVTDLRRIGDHLIRPSKPDEIWSNGARQFFLAAALYFYGKNEAPTLSKIKGLVEAPGGLREWCKMFLKDPQASRDHHPECLAGFRRLATGPADTVGGMLENLHEALFPLTNETTRAVVSGNTFDLRDLVHRRISIYVRAQPKDLSQYGSLLRLFFQQVIDLNTRTSLDGNRLKGRAQPVLLGLDEFASLGPLPAVEQGITTMRSYRLTTLAIVQSPSQMFGLYGPDGARTLLDNFGCAVFFTPGARAFDIAQELSNLLGTRTQRTRSFTRRRAFGTGQDSDSFSSQRRPLMLPQEILTMSSSAVIVRAAGYRPVKAEKLTAATDRQMRQRYRSPPVAPTLPRETRWLAPNLTPAADVTVSSHPEPEPPKTPPRGPGLTNAIDTAEVPLNSDSLHVMSDGDLDQLGSLRAADFSYGVDVDLESGALDDEAAERLIERIWQQVSLDPHLGRPESAPGRSQSLIGGRSG